GDLFLLPASSRALRENENADLTTRALDQTPCGFETQSSAANYLRSYWGMQWPEQANLMNSHDWIDPVVNHVRDNEPREMRVNRRDEAGYARRTRPGI